MSMPKNVNNRKFLKWALLDIAVGESFNLDELISAMMIPRRTRGNIKRKRMDSARASALLGEWVRKGYVSKESGVGGIRGSGSCYTLRRRVDDSSPIEHE